MERPQEYCPQAAVLLGPTEPNPAVCAAVARSMLGHAASKGDACAAHAAAAAAAAGSSFVAAVRSVAPHAAAAGPTAGHLSRVSAPAAYPAGASPAATAAAAGSAACSKGGSRDLVLPADQSKQDEVFIGGLPSHWKAQQVGGAVACAGRLHACMCYAGIAVLPPRMALPSTDSSEEFV